MSNPIISSARASGIKALNREQNEALYQRIRQGDGGAINEMIEGNIALVIVTVSNYTKRNPTFHYLRDDLQSACYLSLTHVVKQLGTIDVDNPMGYLYESLRTTIVNTIWDSQAVVVPKRLRSSSNPRKVSSRMDSFLSPDPADVIKLRLLVHACCESTADHTIVEMREQGYTDLEISRALDVDRATVCRARSAIYGRYQEVAGIW